MASIDQGVLSGSGRLVAPALAWLRRALLLAGLVGSLAVPVRGMDLRQVYEAAVENDATIRAARAGATAMRERLPQAQAQLRPAVSMSMGRNYNDLVSEGRGLLGQPSKTESQYYSGNQTLSLRQPLYRPLLLAQLRQARAQVQDADASLERDEQGLVVRVGEAYFEALLAQDQLLLVLSQKEASAAQLDAARKGVIAGSGTRTDVDEAQARLDLSAAQELEARQHVEFANHRITVLTGQKGVVLAKLAVDSFLPAGPAPSSIDAWIAQAEENSPELQALRAQLEAARQEVNKARAGHLPTLDAVAQWSRTHSDSVTSINSRYDQKSVGLQLSIPLYSGGHVSSSVRQAVAAQDRAQELLEAARLDLGTRVYREFRAMTEGLVRIRALQQAEHSAGQAVISNQKSFQAGSRTVLDVLNSEQQKTMALRDLAQARYMYLLSYLRLHSLVGADRAATIMQVNRWLQP